MTINYTIIKKSWISDFATLVFVILSVAPRTEHVSGNDILETARKINSENTNTFAPLEFAYKYAGTDADTEHRLAYFREDLSLAASHMHFHFILPLWSPEIVNKRGGELFYYFHQQLIARYDAERISVGLSRVAPFSDLHQPIIESFLPNIPNGATAVKYSSRQANSTISDVPGKCYVDELITWHDRITKAAENGVIIQQNGTELRIDHPEGISLLGDLVQSTKDTPNAPYYGCYHKGFHEIIGKISDPTGDNLDLPASFYIATMDPLLYTFHKHLNNIFVSLKKHNPVYNKNELSWSDVEFKSISVKGDLYKAINDLTTYTQEWQPLLSHGLDFRTNIPIRVLFKVLQHEEFTYHLKVNNIRKENVTATVRLLIAPIFDATGIQIPFQEQRQLFIELDKFKIEIKPGRQNITRHSTQSSVTIPLRKTTQLMLDSPMVYNNATNGDPCMWPHKKFDMTRFSKEQLWTHSPFAPAIAHKYCGWPHHLLIPRGNKTGIKFSLFAMLTDWQEDKVQSFPEQDFNEASAYCGNFNETYPDKRSMGFPFDRFMPERTTLDSFLLPNMAVTTITIFHSDKVVQQNEFIESII